MQNDKWKGGEKVKNVKGGIKHIFYFSAFLLFYFFTPVMGAFDVNYAFGARAMGMAGAYTAVRGDCDSILWNPAGLSGVKNFQISSMYM
ncbi:MAG: hypothetical protein J7L54_07260, partial [Elusimicrobia bacterium]|nr:hypothetical protein [Elusimicrobiota bacterium]